MRLLAGLLLVAAVPALAAPPAADTLPRTVSLGVAMDPPAEGQTGVPVTRVLPGTTAEKLGVQTGDTIVSAGSRAVASVADVGRYVGTLVSGSPVELTIRRGGKTLNLKGKALGRPPIRSKKRPRRRRAATSFGSSTSTASPPPRSSAASPTPALGSALSSTGTAGSACSAVTIASHRSCRASR